MLSAHCSKTSVYGSDAPAYFTGVKDQWRQCFPGGLLSTCGLGNVGPFCTDETAGIGAQDFSQHGRISNQCAENICLQERWHGEQFEVTVSGTVHEAQLRAEHFSLCRTVRSCLGESRIFIDDVITNEDFIERTGISSRARLPAHARRTGADQKQPGNRRSPRRSGDRSVPEGHRGGVNRKEGFYETGTNYPGNL